MEQKNNSIVVPEGYRSERADIVISDFCSGISRSNIKNRLAFVKVNGQDSKLSRKVVPGDLIEYSLNEEPSENIKPEPVELDVLFENPDVVVINKPEGMVVHPAAGNYSGTMAQGLMFRLQNEDTGFENGDTRPGIVHRLDKDTSGVIIAAKNSSALTWLAAQFSGRKASKTYLAVIRGRLPHRNGKIEGVLARDRRDRKKFTWKSSTGKSALTVYRVMKEWDNYSLVALSPKTGRTHQLRVHMLSMGTPIAGDPVYGKGDADGCGGLMLHAWKLRIVLPGEDSVREFKAPVPERFRRMIRGLADRD